MTIHIQDGLRTSNEIWKVIGHNSQMKDRRSKNDIDDPLGSYLPSGEAFGPKMLNAYFPMSLGKNSLTLSFVYHFFLFGSQKSQPKDKKGKRGFPLSLLSCQFLIFI